ncbi:MAG: tetratricopeptide repeat protein [Sedimentisphaerales bacterium]
MTKERKQLLLIIAGLVAATIIAYEPVRHNDFVGYDDPAYITGNPDITSGLTLQSFKQAFTSPHSHMWHPLTTLSHILDCQLFGLNPMGHHFVSVLFHILNALLLFWILVKITGAIWPSAFVAAVFALHPLQVESVAWAAERKTVLSGLFWFLTIAVYVWYTKKPGIWRYIPVFIIYSLCIMTKPVVVTLPIVLILLDYWPLNRIYNSEFRIKNEELKEKTSNSKFTIHASIYEKIPLFALSAFLGIITFVTQQQGGAVAPLENFPVHIRIIDAMGNYFNYIVKMLCPRNLAVLYPIPRPLQMTPSIIAPAIMSAVVLPVLWLLGRKKRWFVAGFLWYLVTLAPMIGLVQAGIQIMADRYVYLPIIGIFIIIAWGTEEILRKTHHSRIIPASAVAILVVLVIATRIQTTMWRDTPTLFSETLAATKNNYIMHDLLGEYLCWQDRPEEGLLHLQEAVRIWPGYPQARINFCHTLLILNRIDEAIDCYNKAIEERNEWQGMYEIYQGLGWAYEQKNNLSLAEKNYRKALELKPDFAPAQDGLASVQAKRRQRTDDK